MVTRYIIEVTEEELAGLKHACAHTQGDYERKVPENERAVEAFRQRQDPHFERIARKNLQHARTYLALVSLAAPVLYRAELKPARRSSTRLATPSPVASHEATDTAELLPGGNGGTTPPAIDPAGGALECHRSLMARVLTQDTY